MWRPALLPLLLLAPAPAGAAEEETRRGRSHVQLQAEVVAPASDGFGGRWLGYGGSFASWIDLDVAVIIPRMGLRYGPGGGGSYFLDGSGDVGAFWVPLDGWLVPIVGAGAGVRWLYTRGRSRIVTEGVIVEQTLESVTSDWHLGFGVYGRAGALLFRNRRVHMTAFVDYTVAFFGDAGRPRAAVGSLGLAF